MCRHGGDEFIVLLNGVASEEDAARAATRLLAMLAQPIVLGTNEVFVSASIGIVLYPRDGDELDTLLKNADVAMYHAKAQGCGRFFFYHESMREASAQRLSLEHDLRKALEDEQFELYYQPQIEVTTGRIVGVEALDTLESSDARNARTGAFYRRGGGGRADHGDLGVGAGRGADSA